MLDLVLVRSDDDDALLRATDGIRSIGFGVLMHYPMW